MRETKPAHAVFKSCPNCKFSWQTREAFLSDPLLEQVGYMADFERLEDGLFFFNHLKATCLTTLVLPAKVFLDLYSGKRYSERRIGKEDCPGYCLDKEQLARCGALCECAFVREVIQVIKDYPKTGEPDATR